MENKIFKSRTKEARKIYNKKYYETVTKLKNSEYKLIKAMTKIAEIKNIENIINEYKDNTGGKFCDWLYATENGKYRKEAVTLIKYLFDSYTYEPRYGFWLNIRCKIKLLATILSNNPSKSEQ